MQGHLVLSCIIDTFDYVNLSIVWPIRSYCPECRPGSASAAGNMGEISNDQAMLIRWNTLQSDAISTFSIGVQMRGIIDTDVDLITLNLVQPLILGVTLVHIVDKPICWIWNLASLLARLSRMLVERRTA